MTGIENTSEKNNGNEEAAPDEDLPLNTKGLIYKTEITIALNESDDISEEDEELVVLRNKNTKINRSAYSKLHKASNSRFSTLSLGRFELFSNFQRKLNTSGSTRKRAVTAKENPFKTHFENTSKNSDEESVDFVPCVIRKSESVDTVDRIEKELSNFIMDNKKKEKKRTNSFRKFFSVFGKDKKKKGKETDVNSPCFDYADNYQNETHSNSFIRNTPQRHTVGCDHINKQRNFDSKPHPKNIEEDPPPEILRQYADSHINKFNKIRKSFENPDDNESNIKHEFSSQRINPNVQHSHDLKFIDTSSSATSTVESGKLNTYQNALIAQAEIQQLRKDNNVLENRSKLVKIDSFRRDTPPRATDTYQPVNIVKPRARLPINSGRPLPNPYHNEIGANTDKLGNTIPTQETEDIILPELSDIYGTVFDAISQTKSDYSNRTSTITSQDSKRTLSPVPKSPRSPSLEGSKLRLPSNRDTTPLQPRLRSPLPSSRVSTEKIIATELLKNTNSGDKKLESVPNPQKIQPYQKKDELLFIPQAESTPDTKTSQALNALREKFEENSQKLNDELDQIKQTLQNISHEESPDRTPSRNGKINRETSSNSTLSTRETLLNCTNTSSNPTPSPGNTLLAHEEILFNPTASPRGTFINCKRTSSNLNPSPRGTLLTSPRPSMTISPLPHTKCLEVNCSSPQPGAFPHPSPDVELRPKYPVVRRNGSQSNINRSPSSPNKDEIRKSVEAYYWKEIKRIKEQEDYEIYLSQLHFSQKGYAEDPILSRRSRGLDGNREKRSSSVPRNPKQHKHFDRSQQNVNILHMPIPVDNAAYHMQDKIIYGYTTRNPRVQSSSNAVPNSRRQTSGEYGTYKPIFRRGSLSGGTSQNVSTVQSNKKVSFSNSQQPTNIGAWPTKNGFTRSPPQRRLEKASNNAPTNAPLEDDVFLPPVQSHPNMQICQPIYGQNQVLRNHYNSDAESIYGQNVYGYTVQPQMGRPANYNSDSEAIFGGRYYRTLSRQEMENLRNAQANSIRPPDPRIRPVPRLTRHESMQLPESPYGYAVHYGENRNYQSNNVVRDNRLPVGQNRISPRREILITDNIYGQHIGYRNDLVASPYGYAVSNSQNIPEPMYGSRPKQITVRNKVCDMYGRIHDVGAMGGGIQASGILMGQLQDLPTSPQSFRRGTRLTASSNDMLYGRHNYQQDGSLSEQKDINQMHVSKGSVRPLPPLPPTGKTVNSDNKCTKKNNSSKKKKN